MPSLREQFGAKIPKEGFRGADLVPAGVRLVLPLQELRLAFLGFPLLSISQENSAFFLASNDMRSGALHG